MCKNKKTTHKDTFENVFERKIKGHEHLSTNTSAKYNLTL